MTTFPDLTAAARRVEWIDALDALLVERLRARARPRGPGSALALEAVLLVLCRACAEGSLHLPLDATLPARVQDLFLATEITGMEADHLVACFLADLEQGVHVDLVGTPESPASLVRFGGNLYLHRFFWAERTLGEGLAARRGAEPLEERLLDAILRETLDEKPLRAADGSPLRLTPQQRLALATSLQERVFVLSGGPGTGKTTWTAAWLRAILRLPGSSPERVRLCAPTGRAARRLEESLRERLATSGNDPVDEAARAMTVTTLHAMLGYRAFEGRYARGPEDPLDADWILLDEASMADVFLLAALARALRPSARLVLAGDPDQLPAVEAGAVLSELLPENPDEESPVPSVALDVGHRARGEVVTLAETLRRGDGESLLTLLGEPVPATEAFASPRGILRVAPAEDGGATTVLQAYARDAFAPREGEPSYAEQLARFRTLHAADELSALDALWRCAARTRVLSPLRHGPFGAERANRTLRELLESSWKRPGDGPGTGFHGAPILVTRNDGRTGLSNGDIGLWLEGGDGPAVFFPRADAPGGWLRLQVALLPPHQLGFASTVHKSQGSEYDEVLVLLPPEGNRLLVREVLYTAVTRARAKVRILGSDSALREAASRRLMRSGGLRRWFSLKTG